MPNNKRQNKSKKGRRSGPRGTGGANSFGLAPLLPPLRRVHLPYAEKVNITEAVAGAGAQVAFSLNSLFDPNAGGVGLQPVGFDQISAMYGQFRVWGVKVKITYCNSIATPIQVSMFATYQPAAPINPDAWVCQPYGANGFVDPLGGRSNKVLQKSFSIPLVLGLTKTQYDADMDFVGTPSGNPTRQCYLIVGILSMTTTVGGIGAYVQLEYDAQFSQPLALTMS
jgi:hypothetical protein